MDEAPAADGPYLAGAKHPADRYPVEHPAHQAGVVMGLGKEVGATAVAGEQECSVGGSSVHELMEVLVGRDGIPHLELDDGPNRHLVADRHRTGSLVHAENTSYQEVAPAEVGLVLIDDPASDTVQT